MASKRRLTDVDATSLRRIDVSSMSLRCHVPVGYSLHKGSLEESPNGCISILSVCNGKKIIDPYFQHANNVYSRLNQTCFNAESKRIYHRSPMQTEKSQPEGKRIMPETSFTEFSALSVDPRVGISRSALKTDD